MKLSKDNIIRYADKYDNRYNSTPDSHIEEEIKQWFESNRFLDRDNFLKLCRWKSPRPRKSYEQNRDDFVREITAFSLSTNNEEARIKSLLILNGVQYPVASTILHFAFPDRYPIMDFRAIWSLEWQQPKAYTFEFWQNYCKKIRSISKRYQLTIRTVDKALWQYSKEKQNGR